jgi:hypothetical protein
MERLGHPDRRPLVSSHYKEGHPHQCQCPERECAYQAPAPHIIVFVVGLARLALRCSFRFAHGVPKVAARVM